MPSVSETASGKVYLVNYDENLFLSYTQESQDFCFETWIKKAAPMGCNMVVLRLHPDEWFPTHGNEKPYIFKQVPIEGEKAAPYVVRTQCSVELTDAYAALSENEQLVERQNAREAGKRSGCDAWLVIHGTTVLERGRNRA